LRGQREEDQARGGVEASGRDLISEEIKKGVKGKGKGKKIPALKNRKGVTSNTFHIENWSRESKGGGVFQQKFKKSERGRGGRSQYGWIERRHIRRKEGGIR